MVGFEVVVGILAALLSAYVGALVSGRRFPSSYRIAIIGFPQSGKTTLITALFGHLFGSQARSLRVVPRGDETIRRVNSNLEALELGRAILPTTDQDVFAYRADVTIGQGYFTERIKLEIGDFPGENTEEFAEAYGDWLHETPYFRWAMEADGFLFIVDSAQWLLLGPERPIYVARLKKAYRAAWQRLQEHHLDGARDLAKTRVALIFTKADVLQYSRDGLLRDSEESVRREGFGTHAPKRIRVDKTSLKRERDAVEADFADLIGFFSGETTAFEMYFTSVFWKPDGCPFGIRELSSFLLPVKGRSLLMRMLRPLSTSLR